MKCPICGGATQVLSTRGIVRRRECKLDISHRFDTEETVIFIGSRPQGRPSKEGKTRDDIKRWNNLK